MRLWSRLIVAIDDWIAELPLPETAIEFGFSEYALKHRKMLASVAKSE